MTTTPIKRTITYDQFLQLVGLLIISRDLNRQADAAYGAAARIICFEGDTDYDQGGYVVQDISYESGDPVADLKRKMRDCGIKVKTVNA